VHSLLILILDGGEWSASHTDCFIPREETISSQLNTRQAGPQNHSDHFGE